MRQEAPEAAAELFVIHDDDPLRTVTLAFHIETPDVGARVGAYLAGHRLTPIQQELARSLDGLASAAQALHRQWMARPQQYDLPDPASFTTESELVHAFLAKP
jgi:hypothetical protein